MRLFIILLFYLFGCSGFNISQNKAGSGSVQSIGYVKLMDAKNGIYIIQTIDGKRYVPVNLKPEFKVDSLKVSFKGIVDTVGLKNVRLMGMPLKIDKMRKN